MNNLPYNIYDKDSIVQYAKKLIDKNLETICPNIITSKQKNKGGFGQLLEEHYFLYKPNSDSEPDFKEVGLELKSSPIKKLKRLQYVSKERLVLNIINYNNVVNQTFNTSSFWKKNERLLLVFYLYEKEKSVLEYNIEIVDIWAFSKIDLEIIKNDWEIINTKIKSGKAHELSEGDTLYLAASTKGSRGGNLREQPFNKTKAKQRAYSLKRGYVNHIIATLAESNKHNYGRIIPSLSSLHKQTFEEMILSKFTKYYNRYTCEIEELLNTTFNSSVKNYAASISKSILGFELNEKIEEFSKAEITLKTIRLNEKNLPKEQISFPAFKFTDIIKESWDNTSIKNYLEHKFLFIFFKYKNKQLYLSKAKFWNMPYKDLLEVKKVWNQTKKVIKNGDIIKEIKIDKNGKEKRLTNFPNKTENKVAHIRPHGQNANDVYPLPFKEIYFNKKEYTKQCFWLNNDYIRDNVYLKD